MAKAALQKAKPPEVLRTSAADKIKLSLYSFAWRPTKEFLPARSSLARNRRHASDRSPAHHIWPRQLFSLPAVFAAGYNSSATCGRMPASD